MEHDGELGHYLVQIGLLGPAGILNMVMVLLQVMPPRKGAAAMMGRTKQIHIATAGGMMKLIRIMPPRKGGNMPPRKN